MPVRGRNAGNKGQGSKWISKTRRRKIYDRDGWKCVWCNCMVGIDTYIIDEWHGDRHVVTEVKLATLDHITSRSAGGSHRTENLVTCCMRCNRLRGDTHWSRFVPFIARLTSMVCSKADKSTGVVDFRKPCGLELRRLTAPIRKRIRTILNTNWGY